MLKQASVEDVRQQKFSRAHSQIIIAMCFYPRGIKKEWRDDFRNILAPDRQLFAEWKDAEKSQGHEKAFEVTRYEERFTLAPMALQLLKMYTGDSRSKDIYFVCQCNVGQKCHREMLLLTAKLKYNADTDTIHNSYAVYESRIKTLDDTVKLW